MFYVTTNRITGGWVLFTAEKLIEFAKISIVHLLKLKRWLLPNHKSFSISEIRLNLTL